MRKILILFFLVFSLGLSAQTYTRKTNLPHVYINTFNRQSITSKTTYIYCTLIYVDENDVVTEYDSVSIRGRGNSTWGLSKKPYKLKFKEKTRFLGKDYANAKKWTLIANAGDKSLIRNAITSEMTKFLGMEFSPAAKFVDLTLNNVYLGNYQISDQVDVRKKRVNVEEQDYPLTSTSDITGGYMLEVDGFRDGNWFSSSHSVAIRVHYPDDDECSTQQKSYITNHVNTFESRLFSSDFTDPEKGYRPYVDSLSMANLYIATEISGNIDGFWSMYFYKHAQDDRLYFGPPWDYDIAYDNDYRITNTAQKLMVDDGYGDARTWFRQLWNDSGWFAKLINRRFQEALDDGLEQYMYAKIDSLVDLIYDSQKLNYNKWGISSRMYHEVYLYSTYEEYITQLKNYIHNHIAYLKEAFAGRMPEEPTPPFSPKNFYYNIISVGTGNALDIFSENGIAYSETNLPPAESKACCWANIFTRESEYWKFEKVDDYYLITNRLGLALNDPTQGTSTATTNTGTQLNLVEPDVTDSRQLWMITPQGTKGYYNLTNVYTQHTANLNGGSAANGTQVISYVTDDRNATSNNRLWYIEKTDLALPEEIPSFELELAQGWNWMSHIMQSPLKVTEFEGEAQRIVAQTKEAINDVSEGMTGSLSKMNAGELFKVYMTNSASYLFEGDFCSVSLPIGLKKGWNWIGYLSATPNSVNEALANTYCEDGDVIIGQNGVAVYTDGAWLGSLQSFQPGCGYMYQSASTKALRFAEVSDEVKSRKSPKRPFDISQYDIDPHRHPNVMGMVCRLMLDGNDLNDSVVTVLAYSDGECRGVGQYVSGHLFLTIYGEGGEKISFKVRDDRDQMEYDVHESIKFQSDLLGTPSEPVTLTLSDSESTGIYDLASDMDHLQIQDIFTLGGIRLGNNIYQLPRGIYIVRLTNGTNRKIMVR